ncbi:MAG: TIGR03792 family protein [Leptolyngbyaceae cyanobacterium]
MVIEWLKMRVAEDERERYIAIDDSIWTTALRRYPGFLSKETWIDPDDREVIIFVIRWETREQWKAIPEDELTEINNQFDAAFGSDYTFEASKEFQVRRFPVSTESAR